MKVTVVISETEWFPIYEIYEDLEDSYGVQVEIDSSLLERYRKACEEFNTVQAELREKSGN